MTLNILTPTEKRVDAKVSKVIAEGANGSFCLLPRHIDFVSALQAGLLAYETAAGEEVFLAVDEGILVKRNNVVTVSVRQAVTGKDLASLKQTVKAHFMTLDEQEKKLRSSLARLEAHFVRQFVSLGQGHD